MREDLKKQIESFVKVADDFVFEMNGKQFREFIETAQKMGIESVRSGFEGRCPRHDRALSCLSCSDELTKRIEKL